MSGTGKYTVYAPTKDAKTELLKKLFGTNGSTADGENTLPPQMSVDPDAVKGKVVDIAKAQLQPAHQAGDLGYFPSGVDLDFTGKSASVQPPDTAEGKDVKWTNPGDPANSYVPDITSPGPGKTNGLDKSQDPKIAAKDLKPNYVPAGPGTGTKSPTATNAKVVAANLLGVPGKLGDSGGNV